MKKIILTLTMTLALMNTVQGANVASDSAADVAYDAGWTNGVNGGSGFAAWQLTTSDGNGLFTGSSSGNAGGSSGDIDTAGRSWGMWSTNGLAEAVRPLTGGDLTTQQVLSISLDNGYLTSARSVGIGLRNSSGDTLWQIYFSGDETFYTINDAFGANPSTTPYTGNGLNIEFSLTSSTSWLARVTTDFSSWNLSGVLIAQPDMGIEQIRAWNYEAGAGSDYDAFINSMSVINETITLTEPNFTFEIVETSQTNCYDASTTITPPAPGAGFAGQDGQYAGNSMSYVLANGGKVVQDTVTGLTWQQTPDIDDDGDIDVNDKLTWDELQTYPAALNAGNFGGYSDWRLPTIKELYSLIDFRGTDPSVEASDGTGLRPFINTDYFAFAYGDTAAGERIIDSQYGSKTLYVAGSQLLFGVNFADGRIKGYGLTALDGSDKTFVVCCCRGNTSYGENNLVDNGDGTISDLATGLTWQQADSVYGMNWEDALAYAEGLELGGYKDWRLPNVKELQSIVDYTRSPDTTSSAAIDSLFTCSTITNLAGVLDYPFYWSGTTHFSSAGTAGQGCYVAFGRGLGTMDEGVTIIDVHGAGCQRSDPKTGDAADYPNSGNGPQGDVSRVFNHVRCVRSATVSAPIQDSDADGMSDWYEYSYVTNITAMTPDGDLDNDGSSNASEYGAGTSPVDSNSSFSLEQLSQESVAGPVITWKSVLGKTYRIERTTNLTAGVFSDLTGWNIPATPPMNVHTDTTATGGAAYYRIVVN